MNDSLLKFIVVLIISLSSFLIFTSELVIARFLLPFFGGAASLWIISMMFFTTILFVGYLYAHFLIRKFSIKYQLIIHQLFLLFLITKIKILPESINFSLGLESPTFYIIKLRYI